MGVDFQKIGIDFLKIGVDLKREVTCGCSAVIRHADSAAEKNDPAPVRNCIRRENLTGRSARGALSSRNISFDPIIGVKQ